METLLQINEALGWYKYLLLFALVLAEGPIATVAAGLAVSLGQLDKYAAYAIIIFGDLAGDMLYYLAGRFSNKGFFRSLVVRAGGTPERLASLAAYFQEHGGKTLVTGKFSHGIGGVFLVAAGLARMSAWKFLFYNFIATLPKSLGLMLAGFYFGHSITTVKTVFDWIAIISVLSVLAGVIAYWFWRDRQAK